MKYLLAIYANEAEAGKMTPEDGTKMSQAHGAYAEALVKAGVMQGGQRLRPASDATTVRVRNGKALTTDGPFAETKEQLGGYYLIDVANLDEAIKWAAKIPSALHGSIEIRPLTESPTEAQA